MKSEIVLGWHFLAAGCAERALRDAKVTDNRCWNALNVKRAWLKGKATDEELEAAYAAAWAAARAAAREAQNKKLTQMFNKLLGITS